MHFNILKKKLISFSFSFVIGYEIFHNKLPLIFDIKENPTVVDSKEIVETQVSEKDTDATITIIKTESGKIFLEISRGGKQSKTGPGARAKSDAARVKGVKNKRSGSSTQSNSGYAEALANPHPGKPKPSTTGGLFAGRPKPNYYNPGAAGPPRSVSCKFAQKNEELDDSSCIRYEAPDGFECKMSPSSQDHLLAKHGHNFGIDDPLPPNPQQKQTKYKQIRTRITKENKEQFAQNFGEVLSRSKPYPDIDTDIDIRGVKSRFYYSPEDEVGIGVPTEGDYEGQIMQAQPISDQQLDSVKNQNKLY
jgi:hypothetical protein